MSDKNLNPELCVAILAGGQSRRMGMNKALLPLDGRPLIEKLVEEARLLTDEIWISANQASIYDFLKLPVVPDIYAERGPLSGLHAVMLRTGRPLILLLACDLPDIRAPLLRRLVQSSEGYEAVIPRTSDGGLHPLCAVYRRSCLASVERNLRANLNKMTDIFQDKILRVLWLEGTEGKFADQELINLNAPKDLEAFNRSLPQDLSQHLGDK